MNPIIIQEPIYSKLGISLPSDFLPSRKIMFGEIGFKTHSAIKWSNFRWHQDSFDTDLSGSDLANNFATVRRHKRVEGCDDALEVRDASVLGHADEQVLGQRVHLQLVAGAG